MKKDKMLAVRIPEVVHSKLIELAEKKGITLTELVLSSLSGLTWEIELERNIAYHKAVIRQIRETEKMMRSTQRQRSKVITGKAVAPKRHEQLDLVK